LDWENQGQFFAAAAEAMRRILIERARKNRVRREAGLSVREELEEACLASAESSEELLEVMKPYLN
jgi:hypothetical protein